MVRRQYSGNVGGIVQGIGVVVMFYYVPQEDKFYLLGYRIFDPASDGKSKVHHLMDVLTDAETHCVRYHGVLMGTGGMPNLCYRTSISKNSSFRKVFLLSNQD